MENQTFVLLAAVAVNLIILYYIIESATKSNKLKKYNEMQVKLLMKIAEKQGVSNDEIKEATKW